MPLVRLKIDVTKIDKERLFKGKKGTYLDAALHEKANDFGDDGFITQDIGKEARAAGEKGAIIGNWRYIGEKPTAQQPPPPPRRSAPPRPPADPDLDAQPDEIPFSVLLPILIPSLAAIQLFA